MTSGPSGWLPIAITSATSLFAGGSVGALITTYGGKGRERRKARSEAMTALLACEQARRSQQFGDRLTNPNREGIAQLQAMCLLACVPRDLVRMYQEADEQWRIVPFPPSILSPQTHEEYLAWAEFQVAVEFIDRTADLLTHALWHPRRSALLRRLHVRKLRKMRYRVFRQGKPILSLYGWYRFWRALSHNLTRRDRIAVRVRGAFHLTDPLEKKSNKYQLDQASRRPKITVGSASPDSTVAVKAAGNT
jgi:hypothetical protein